MRDRVSPPTGQRLATLERIRHQSAWSEAWTDYDYASGKYAGIGRYKINKTFNLTSSRIGVSYAITPTINLFGTIARSDQMPYIPRNQYSLFADYRHPNGFRARIQANSWGAYYMDTANTEKYGGYDLVTNLALGYETGPHNLWFNVDNLFDKHYAMEVKKNTRGKKYYSAATPLAAMLTYSYNF